VSVDAALALIERSAPPPPSGPTLVALGAAAVGQVTAAPLHAALDMPRFDASAMDGFALRSADTRAATPAAPASLLLAAAIPAGVRPAPLRPGEAAPISTGAMAPAGADTILVKEEATVANGRLRVATPLPPGRNLRRRGEDVGAGRVVFPRGTVLTAEAIGTLAGCGLTQVPVHPRPTIGLISTGSELAADAAEPDGAALIDSNRPMIEAACAGAGLPCRFLATVRDDRTAVLRLFERLADLATGDIILTTGGISAGDYDLVRPALEAHGGRVIFHGIAMRPGKPLLFALLPDGRPFFGLPGNPVSALIGFRFFVMAAVRAMLGLAAEAGTPVATDQALRPGVTQFLKARRTDPGGWATAGLDQRSHVLSAVARADGWLRLDQDADGGARALIYPKAATLG
jgi:molybdopterin molybdotransferase